MLNRSLYRLVVVVFLFVLAAPGTLFAYSNAVTFTGQGANYIEGSWELVTELCGTANGADVDGPYLLWVLTATGAKNADITGPWGTATMTKTGNGTFKYVSGYYNPATLPAGVVIATYDGKAKNAQLVISHGCRPFVNGSWCSPGFWKNAADAAWAVTGHAKTELFNATVYDGFYGALLSDNPTLGTVVGTNGGTYTGPGVAGTQFPTLSMNAFNAVGAYLSNQIPGYQFDPALYGGDDQLTCPIDHHGNFKTPSQ
jgi:hypothetical protein